LNRDCTTLHMDLLQL